MMKKIYLTLCLSLMTLGLHAENWAQWRGPHHDGSAPEKAQTADFSKTKNVKWKTELPGPSGATPVIFGDKVFLTSVDEGKQQLLGICVDRQSGKILWSKNIGSGYKPAGAGTPIALGTRSNYASPSPVTDGNNVIFSFGNGDIVCLDFSGNEKWKKNIQKEYGDFCYQWTFSASPTLYDGKFYYPVLQRNEQAHDRGNPDAGSYILCLDPNTGKEIWKHMRPSKAIVESLEAYGTLIPYEKDGKKQLVLFGADIVTVHDAATGKETWRWGTWNPGHEQQWWRTVPSPVIGKDTVLVCAPKKQPVYAVDLTATPDAENLKGMIWNSDGSRDVTSDVPTPLYYKDHFYVLSDVAKKVSKVEAKSGKVLWTVKLPSKKKWRGSPTASDNKIYIMNHGGTVVVLDAGDGKTLLETEMGEDRDDNIRSSIPIVDSQLFIRTNKHLYCIEKS